MARAASLFAGGLPLLRSAGEHAVALLVRVLPEQGVRACCVARADCFDDCMMASMGPEQQVKSAPQADLIKHIGPSFQSAGIKIKIMVYYRFCDRPDYADSILNYPVPKTRESVWRFSLRLSAPEI